MQIENQEIEVKNTDDYVKLIIDKTNVSFTDGYGNSCLYYLVKHNMWKKYKNILLWKNKIKMDLCFFAVDDGFAEAIIRGLRASILTE